MEVTLAISQTPSLVLEAMRRPVRRRPRRRAGDGKGGERLKGEGGPPPTTDFPHNNYLARAKVGAPFGNRNAVKPGLAELRSLKAKVKAHLARMNAAIAAAEALIAARKAARPRRRIDCHTYEVDGVVMRVRAVVRINKRCLNPPLEGRVSASVRGSKLKARSAANFGEGYVEKGENGWDVCQNIARNEDGPTATRQTPPRKMPPHFSTLARWR